MTQSQLYPQLALLERMLDLLKAMPPVRAAFLRGSFHSNEPELGSDIDLVVVATDAEPEALVELGRAVLPSAGDVQWVSLLALIPARLRALLAGPIRVDLTVVTAATLPVYEGWRILFDHDNLLRERARYTPASDTLRPEHVAAVCDEFWWRLFSCVGQIKRGQLWLALHLLSSCRDSLVQIMRWRRDPSRPFEQYANLEQHLTPEDQQALAQTLASYDLRSIATALLCTADAFDPAAREVAARVQAHYPAALAQLSKEFFIREFWALIAPGPTMSA